MSSQTISRRSLLRASALGLAGIAVGSHPVVSRGLGSIGMPTAAADTGLHLTMRECLMEMVDLSRVYMWAFDSPHAGLRVPGPVLYAQAGGAVVIDVTNDLPGPHAFAVPGVVDSGVIGPGETRRVEFTAPAAGTYIYLDPTNAPVSRAMGLAGVLVVLPGAGPTPYTTPTPSVTNLFDDLGTTAHFPGDPWRPERTWNWVFSCVDPDAHERVRAAPELSAAEFTAGYNPAYFMLNGKTGFFASNDPSSALHGRVGQPALIRVANVGMADHSPHIHGNHVYITAINGQVQHNVIGRDTWPMQPLSTADALHPFIRPPDAHPWPPSDPDVWTTDLAGDGHHGMVYVVHCHTELSLLAAGSNYPQGLITHWTLEGDLETSEPPHDTSSTSSTSSTSTTSTTSSTTTTSTTMPPASSSSTTSTSTSTSTTSSTSSTTSTTMPASTSTTSTTTSTTTPRPGRPKPPKPPKPRRPRNRAWSRHPGRPR